MIAVQEINNAEPHKEVMLAYAEIMAEAKKLMINKTIEQIMETY